MKGTVDSVDYEEFDYKFYDQEPLQLDEAIRKVAEMRSKDPAQFHHLVPIDHEGTKFCVESIPIDKAQNERWSRWVSALMGSMMLNLSKRHG